MGKQLVIKDANFAINAIYKAKLKVTKGLQNADPSIHEDMPNALWVQYGPWLNQVLNKKIVGVQLYRSPTSSLTNVTQLEIYKFVTSVNLTSFGSDETQPITSTGQITSIDLICGLDNYDQQVYNDFPNQTPIQLMFKESVIVDSNTTLGIILSDTVSFAGISGLGYSIQQFSRNSNSWTPLNYQRRVATFDWICEDN